MSAYMVENSTILAILSLIQERQAKEYVYGVDKTIREKFFSNCSVGDLRTYSNEGQLVKLGNELIKLNAMAIYDRYDDYTLTNGITSFAKVWKSDRTATQDYKTLQCFLYQCSESNYRERELFRIMEDLANTLASEIVQSSEAYDLAEWC